MTARRPLRSLLAVSLAALAAAGALFAPAPGAAQEPLRIEITEGVIEPMPIAIPAFAVSGGASAYAQEIRQVVVDDLAGSGLFRIIDPSAYLAGAGSVDQRPDFENWRVINAEALGIAEAASADDGRLQVRFQLWDVFGA